MPRLNPREHGARSVYTTGFIIFFFCISRKSLFKNRRNPAQQLGLHVCGCFLRNEIVELKGMEKKKKFAKLNKNTLFSSYTPYLHAKARVFVHTQTQTALVFGVFKQKCNFHARANRHDRAIFTCDVNAYLLSSTSCHYTFRCFYFIRSIFIEIVCSILITVLGPADRRRGRHPWDFLWPRRPRI